MIITLTGPTCAGKTTLEKELQRLGCGRAISHTTRAPRQGESNGNHYHFVTHQQFAAHQAAGDFIEVVELGPNRYAMSKAALKAAQVVALNVAIVVDPHGADQIRTYCLASDMPVYSVWVDCGVKEQSERFMDRVHENFDAGTPYTAKEAIALNAERLTQMLGTEAAWRMDAARWEIKAGTPHKYDEKINSSGVITPRQLAANLLSRLPNTPFIDMERAQQ